MEKNILYRAARKIYHLTPFYKGREIQKVEDISYRPLKRDKFMHKVLKYDIISFDIFDTLITRLIYEPNDVFRLIGQQVKDDNFFEKRKEAERKANESLKKDVNLAEIYLFYKKIYPNENVKKLQTLEEQIELKLSFPRIDMREVFNELKLKGKEIILTSDMYLSRKTIEKMLKKNGYQGYSKLYLSNEIDKRKDRKDMWSYLVDKYKGKKIIHIGDNENSDVIYPKEFGIAALKIESGRQLFNRLPMATYLKEFTSSNNISNSLLLGLIINKKIFNSPFSDLRIHSLNDFGYCFHGPILWQFLSFINEQGKEADKLLFLAREGYYLQKLYYEYCKIYNIKEKDNVYFLASRKATSTANIRTVEDIHSLLDNEFIGTTKDFYKQILEVDYKEPNEELHLPLEKEKVLKNLAKYETEILTRVKEEKNNYLKYVRNTLGDNYKDKNLILVDLGYSGTIQYQLTKLMNKEIKGLYVTNSSTVKRYSDKSVLQFLFDINENEEYKKLYYYSLILEFFLSAPYGQLLKFTTIDGKVKAVYNNELLDENKQKTLDMIYEAVLEFINDAKDISDLSDFNPDKLLLVRIYSCIVEENLVDVSIKDKFSIVDSFSASGSRNVFKIISKY